LVVILTTVVLFATSGCGALGLGRREGEAAREAVPVEVTQATKRDLIREAEFAGQVRGWAEVTLTAKVQAPVEEVLAEVGQRVRKGQVLARLQAPELVAQLRQAEAAVEVAESGLALAEAGPSPAQAKVLEAQVAQAEVDYRSAEADWKRMQYLYEQGAVSQQQWEQAQARYEAAKARLVGARANLEAAKPRPEQIRQARAQVKQARAAAEALRVQLRNYTITSPLDGVVTFRGVDPGSMAAPGMALFTVVQLDPAMVEVVVGEREINFVRVGQPVEVAVPAVADQPFQGRIVAASPGLDARSGGYRVKVEIPNPQERIKPGMAARVRLPLDKLTQWILIPVTCLVDRGHGPMVFVVEGGRAVERRVEVEATGQGLAAIARGLKEGDLVVVKGQEFLQANDPVQVVSSGGGERT
jgi:multidrug efflux pump subunit AcrA (membrane-fusion protein)